MNEEERNKQHQETKTSKLVWKVVIISIVLLVVSVCYVSPWILPFSMYYSRLTSWWEEKTGPTTEEWRAKRRAFIENCPSQKLTGKEVAELLRKEQTIKTQELYDMADWYVYLGDRDVIKQVLANRQFEIVKSTPTRDVNSTSINYMIVGKHIGPSWNTDIERLVQHQEMHRYATNKNIDPYFIYYLVSMSQTFKTNKYRDYYGHLLFYNDILAYLRIYVNYKDWPAIQSRCKDNIIQYPCGWCDWDTIDEVLKIAEEQGVEPAYELYMERYRSNYRRFNVTISNYEKRREIYKYRRYENIFRGWLSENIEGEMRVYKVDSNEAVINIRYVEKIISVLRDGEDITNQCYLTHESTMKIPLKEAEVVKLKYQISVGPEWWDYYNINPTTEVTTYSYK